MRISIKKWWMCWKDSDDGHCKILFKFGRIPIEPTRTVELNPRKWIGWETMYKASLSGDIVIIPASIKTGEKKYVDNPDYLEISNLYKKY